MAKQIIGSIPEFTTDESQPVSTDTKQVASESEAKPSSEINEGSQEKETPSAPSTENEPTTVEETPPSVDTGNLKVELLDEIAGLKEARRILIDDLKDLRGTKREAKQAELTTVEENLDKLEDVNTDDVNLIERILRARGFIRKDEVTKMYSESQKQEEIEKFFKEYPEYSEDHDPERRKFGPLLQEVSLYKEPSDPKLWGQILRRAHRNLEGMKSASERPIAIKKRQVEIAGVGSGGAQRSSSIKAFTPEKRYALQQGGWSEEEIHRMEERSNQE